MEYRRLGKSGLQVSALSLGSWLTFGKQIPDEVAGQLMEIAYDAGVNFFDNAETYANGQSEIVMGNILKEKNWERSSYIVSSKLFFGSTQAKPNQKGLSRKHIMEGCHAALKRLQLEYVDLLFCHRPDKNTPIEETVWAMNHLIAQGKVLYWGTSEWSASELMEAYLVAEKNYLIAPTMEQPQYSMLVRDKMEKEYLHLFKHYGMGTTIWSPLASGLLSGKYNQGMPADTRMNIEGLEWLKERTLQEQWIEKTRRLTDLAAKIGLSMPVFALAWCLKNPNVSTVILGASKTSQLQENLQAIETVNLLTEQVLEEVEQVLQNKPEQPQF
jgi:voltage-dependent potassium channel beta subunit